MSEKDYEIHQCPSLIDSGMHVIYSKNGDELFENSWSLIIQREATEKDLEENHFFENVGDIKWRTVLEISHCPFCGMQLQPPENCKGEYWHTDYSGWSCKVM